MPGRRAALMPHVCYAVRQIAGYVKKAEIGAEAHGLRLFGAHSEDSV